MCKDTASTEHRLSFLLLPLFALCSSYITARRLRTNLHFSSLATLSVFLIPSSFLPHSSLLLFNSFFFIYFFFWCSSSGRDRSLKGGRTRAPGSAFGAHARSPSLSPRDHSVVVLTLALIKSCCCCEANQRGRGASVLCQN